MTHIIHHAMLIEGEGSKAKDTAISHVTNVHGIKVNGNPDLHIIESEKFTIKEARELKEHAYKTPLGEKQVFILIVQNILHEAQNALLKLFEEPVAETYFVLVIPSQKFLLPTVLSRLHFIERIEYEVDEALKSSEFITATIGKRKKLVSSLIKDKDRAGARSFLYGLEQELHLDFKTNHSKLKEIAIAQRYINDKSSSVKMLLEHICVTI